MATKTQLTGGNFQDSEGNILANGYLKFKLSQDSSVTGVGNIASGVEITITLDSNGNVASSTSTPPAANQSIWSNTVLLPVNTFYRVTGFTAQGQPAWGPNNQQVTSGGTGGGTFDLGTWIPNTVVSWSPSLQSVLLETNGVQNGSQARLNLTAGSHVTLTDDGTGDVTIAASGATLETNGTPNSTQTLLNIAAGSGMTIAESAGTVTVTGPTLKTGGVTNSTQTQLNLVAGSGVTVSEAAGAVTIAAAGGGGSVLSATVALSSADLIGLRTTPKTLVAGQVGKTIVPLFVQLIYTFVTTPYTGDSGNVFCMFPGTDITLTWDNGTRATGFVNQSSSKINFSFNSAPNNQQAFPTPQPLASFQGQALSLGFGANQGAAPLSAGDGTMTATVFYTVV
jgi:hypothetical protein